MPSSENQNILNRFIELANRKGAKISHFSISPNRRVILHFAPGSRRYDSPCYYINLIEAVEYLYNAYNLKRNVFYRPKPFQASLPVTTEPHMAETAPAVERSKTLRSVKRQASYTESNPSKERLTVRDLIDDLKPAAVQRIDRRFF